MARVADQLIEILRQEIHAGILKPGDQLEEAALSERFDVSRTPVREAVRSLVENGLLEMRSRKGAVVRVLSAKEIIDLFEISAELEAFASRLASERITRADVSTIREGFQDCTDAAEANDAIAYAAANLKFHKAIHEASGNVWLVDQLTQLETRINPYRSIPYQVVGRLPRSVEEHREIMEAIEAGNGELAANLMRDHMMLQGKRLPMLLQQMS